MSGPYRQQSDAPTTPELVIEPDPPGVFSHDEISAMRTSELVEMVVFRMLVRLPALPGSTDRPAHINGDRAALELDRRIPRNFQ